MTVERVWRIRAVHFMADRNQGEEEYRKRPGQYIAPGTHLSDLLPTGRPHLLQFPKPLKTALPSG
jgi:hypothetical protein